MDPRTEQESTTSGGTKKDHVATAALLFVAFLGAAWVFIDWFLFMNEALDFGQLVAAILAGLMTAAVVQAGWQWVTRKNAHARKRAITFVLFSIALGIIAMEKGMAGAGIADQIVGVIIEVQAPLGFLLAARSLSRGENHSDVQEDAR